jgi:hypothetical protein
VAEERTIAALGEMVGNYPAAVDERVVVVAGGILIEGRESQCAGGEVEDRPT